MASNVQTKVEPNTGTFRPHRAVLTYGTFDLFHVGHLRLLKRLRALGEELHVGVSTDEFNALKGKRTVVPFHHRCEILEGLNCVTTVFAETCWEQKTDDIQRLRIDVLGMGSDWTSKFDDLKHLCNVVYLPRTEDISTTEIQRIIKDRQ